MTERRGEQGFAVVTQSVSGGRRRGRGPNRPQRIGVLVVLLAALGLVAVGLLGPRLSAPPNFDVAYFATPTPDPTPEPTYPRPRGTPQATPLPVVTHADDVTLEGRLAIGGDAFRYLDLATGTTRRIFDVQLWRDALFRTGDDQFVCICFSDEYDATAGPSRSMDLVRIAGDAVTKTTLDRLRPSAVAITDQPDPLVDVAVDRGHRLGLLAVAGRTKAEWQISVRVVDIGAASVGTATRVGRIPLPAFPAGASPTPVPSDQPSQENLYLDGPHVRLAPDGRTAFLWATAQRYAENGEPAVTQGGWRIALAADGSIEDVAAVPDIAAWPQFCPGVAFGGRGELVGLCADPTLSTTGGQPSWLLRTFDADGRPSNAVRLPETADYGYSEPLVDQANDRAYLWDPVALRIVRVDLVDGSIASAAFDPAASSAAGVTSGAAPLPPVWHDGDSAVQQLLFESLAGSPDGRTLYGIGIRPNVNSDTYSPKALGVFAIDPATLALTGRWAPAANDVWVSTLPDGRVVTGGQPGMDVDGAPVSWEGSLTIRDGGDGRILARYGRVATDQAPVLIGP